MNRITLKSVIPHPLKGSTQGSEVWHQELVLNKGSYYLIKADSGKGKSTLLNIIYGIRRDYSGTVDFDNTDIRNAGDEVKSQWRSNRMAYLFQDLRLFGKLTARENILLKPGGTFTSAETEFYAEKLGIANQLENPCSKLSLGQQQRVAIIRTLSQPFQWLLLDEPFSHLDDTNAAVAMELLMQKSAESNAGIISTSLGETKYFQGFHILNL